MRRTSRPALQQIAPQRGVASSKFGAASCYNLLNLIRNNILPAFARLHNRQASRTRCPASEMSALQIHNTLTRKKEPFVPRAPGKAEIYVCGPTVYDYFHIGNARTFTVFDLVVRWLRASGYAVTYVRNITDIDDKIRD